jgi:hypothetical protein
MKKIHWRPIEGFLLYWVSSDGRVRTFNTRKGILKPAVHNGYLRVALCPDGVNSQTKKVHRLVAQAFLRPVPGMDEVNHKDGNKANNNHTNLEWTNRLGNMRHCDRMGLRSFASGEDHGMAKLTADIVQEIRWLYATKKVSYPMLSRMYGISISSAQRTVTRKTWKNI